MGTCPCHLPEQGHSHSCRHQRAQAGFGTDKHPLRVPQDLLDADQLFPDAPKSSCCSHPVSTHQPRTSRGDSLKQLQGIKPKRPTSCLRHTRCPLDPGKASVRADNHPATRDVMVQGGHWLALPSLGLLRGFSPLLVGLVPSQGQLHPTSPLLEEGGDGISEELRQPGRAEQCLPQTCKDPPPETRLLRVSHPRVTGRKPGSLVETPIPILLVAQSTFARKLVPRGIAGDVPLTPPGAEGYWEPGLGSSLPCCSLGAIRVKSAGPQGVGAMRGVFSRRTLSLLPLFKCSCWGCAATSWERSPQSPASHGFPRLHGGTKAPSDGKPGGGSRGLSRARLSMLRMGTKPCQGAAPAPLFKQNRVN